jgi:hypothetical protein
MMHLIGGVPEQKVGVPVFGESSKRAAQERIHLYKEIFLFPIEVFKYVSLDEFVDGASRAIPDRARIGILLIDANLCDADGLYSFDEVASRVIRSDIPIQRFLMKINNAQDRPDVSRVLSVEDFERISSSTENFLCVVG